MPNEEYIEALDITLRDYVKVPDHLVDNILEFLRSLPDAYVDDVGDSIYEYASRENTGFIDLELVLIVDKNF